MSSLSLRKATAEQICEYVDRQWSIGASDLIPSQALCTEAALTAVQRKYPQIYKTTDRLLIKPEEIDVVARDFIISAKSRLFPFG